MVVTQPRTTLLNLACEGGEETREAAREGNDVLFTDPPEQTRFPILAETVRAAIHAGLVGRV